MPEDVTEVRDPVAWMAVLDELAGSLDRSLEQTPVTPPPAPSQGPANSPALQVIDRHLAQMQASMERAEQNAAEAERQLAAVFEPLQQLLEQSRASQEKLAQQIQDEPAA